ncbi:GDP-D-glucose phosphorylase 1-like [Dendronephthya gigantea]|uniref:GDP-D-glucose phosphorylase 1-like n=1 Tax=Dendronephthya gigantea TaxID=151771 RepID=UPI00106C02BA|nr:GDP-D-glucose phosphorylase 1-like [Dendronephthya gigantea]
MADQSEATFVFTYDQDDFHFNSSSSASKFDEEVMKRWDNAMDSGCFKYNLNSVERRIIPGKYNFVAQLNEKRFTQRRAPQSITSLKQPYNSEKFNFTKIPKKEVLLSLCGRKDESLGGNIVVINVSPLEYGNILFVPDVDGQFPQVLTERAIRLSLEMVLLSGKRDFRVGFNSLCAFASVNHLHLHAFYTPYRLPMESVGVSCICDGLYETVDYPITAFVFECFDSKHILTVASQIYKVTSYLHNNELAHNVFFTRGQRLSDRNNFLTDVTHTLSDTLRIFIWVRKPSSGVKNENVFNIAVCELGGFLPIRERTWYENMTEKEVCEKLESAALDRERYEKIRKDISQLVQK